VGELLLYLAMLPLALTLLFVGLRQPMSVVLPLFAATVPFGSLLKSGLPAPYGNVSSVLGLVLIAGLLVQLTGGRSAQVRFPVTVAIWVLFLAAAGASALWSVSAQLTEDGFVNLASLVLLYALLALSPTTVSELRRLELGLLIGGVAAASYGLTQLLFLGGLPADTDGDGGPRFGRDLLGANNTAAALILPLAIALCRSAEWPRWTGRLLYGVSAGLLVTGIVLTGSRGGLLAATACLVTAAMLVSRGRRVLVGMGVAGLVGVLLVLMFNPAGVGSRTESTDSSGRTEIWKVGVAACRTYCLAGSGWGTFPRVYELTQPKVPEARTLVRGTSYEPHNIWILIGVELGLAGLALAAAGLTLTVRATFRLPPVLRGPPLAGLVGTLVAGFFLSNFEYKFFWVVLIYALLCRTVALDTVPPPRSAPPAPALEPRPKVREPA